MKSTADAASGVSVNGFLSDFSNLLDLYVLDTQPVLFIGDFNIHVNKQDDRDSQRFLDHLKTHSLTQFVDKPSHRSGNILDLVITREDVISTIQVDEIAAISDHYTVFFTLTSKQVSSSKRQSISYRNLTGIDKDAFTSDLRESDSLRPTDYVDAESKLQNFNTVISDLLDKHAPVKHKSVPIRRNEAWTNAGIFRARAERRKAEKMWRRTGLTVFREVYKSKRNEVNNLITKSRTQHYHEKITACDGDQKRLFAIVHGLFGSKAGSTTVVKRE